MILLKYSIFLPVLQCSAYGWHSKHGTSRNPRLPSSLLHSKHKIIYLFYVLFNSGHGDMESCIQKSYQTLKAFFSELCSYTLAMSFTHNFGQEHERVIKSVILNKRLYPWQEYIALKMSNMRHRSGFGQIGHIQSCISAKILSISENIQEMK